MRMILPFVVVLALISCEQQKEPTVITWDNGKAVSVSIKRTLLTSDTIPDIHVRGSEYSVSGKADAESDVIRFTPDVPFERGMSYDIFDGQRIVHSFSILANETATIPEIVASFPSCDSVPENLLKIYLVFDQPMMEGRAYDFIHLTNHSTGDTIEGAFLELQPELWSEDEKMLTLWLDPGRIKKDLIPNKTRGTVLSPDSWYELSVSPGWKSKSGQVMRGEYRRVFITKNRDSGKPDVTTWTVGVGNDIVVDMNESLDQPLLSSSISFWHGEDKIAGSLHIQECERTFRFTPGEALEQGTYRIEIESRLEDLAGNNLNRLFETDVTGPKSVSENKSIHTIEFRVR
jgi:hypothetical protein